MLLHCVVAKRQLTYNAAECHVINFKRKNQNIRLEYILIKYLEEIFK